MKNVTFTMWDVGGQDKLRPLWRQFYHGADGVIFIVDSSDVSRIGEAQDELFSMVSDEAMRPSGVPVVVVANKQDLPNALKSYELVERMELRELTTNPWYVQEMCATNGDGIYEGVTMMAQMVKEFRKKSKRRRAFSLS